MMTTGMIDVYRSPSRCGVNTTFVFQWIDQLSLAVAMQPRIAALCKHDLVHVCMLAQGSAAQESCAPTTHREIDLDSAVSRQQVGTQGIRFVHIALRPEGCLASKPE